MSEMYELIARFDSRKSFYGKARVMETENIKRLYSYETEVAAVINGTPVVYNLQSQTTTRHVREFLKQEGFKAESKAQIAKDYWYKKEK